MVKKKQNKSLRNERFAIAYPSERRWQNLAHGVPFSRMKGKVLGKRYELSVAFVSPKKVQELNRRYRRTNASTDILSFALSRDSGELYLSMPDVSHKAREFGMNTRDYLGYVFIHGLLHLEGHHHGRTMDRLERTFCRTFHFSTPP